MQNLYMRIIDIKKSHAKLSQKQRKADQASDKKAQRLSHNQSKSQKLL